MSGVFMQGLLASLLAGVVTGVGGFMIFLKKKYSQENIIYKHRYKSHQNSDRYSNCQGCLRIQCGVGCEGYRKYGCRRMIC